MGKKKNTPKKSGALLEFTLPTTDNWYPNYPRNTVRIKVYDGETWGRICAWGADDFGMEKDFDFVGMTPQDKAKKLKEMLAEAQSFPNPLTQEWLRAKGYKNA